MSKLIEQFARRYAKRTCRAGVTVLVTDRDPLLVEAFALLGWSDPHEDGVDGVKPSRQEAATVHAPERAVVDSAKGRMLA